MAFNDVPPSDSYVASIAGLGEEERVIFASPVAGDGSDAA
jgi:hypothetical protein